MADNEQSAMLEILKRIQTDVSGVKTDVSGLKTDMTDVKARLERLEAAARRQSRDNAALLVMMRGTVGLFDERMGNLEHEVRLLQERD